MDRTILLPSDFSESARSAMHYSQQLYKGRGYRYIILNTVEPNVASSNAGMIVNMSEIISKDSLEGLKKEKEWLSALPESEGNIIETVQMFGEFVSCVRQIVKDKGINMVILGTTGSSGLKEFFVGSNAAAIIQEIAVPVLTVPYQANFQEISRVVFPTDLKPLKDPNILKFLKDLVIKRSAELILLNVVKEESKVSDAQKASEKEFLLNYFESVGVSFETIKYEDTVEGINAYVNSRNDIDVIAMVPRKKNFFEKIFSKSVAKKVAFHANIPILTLQDG
ncbi:MAG: universal stress protein [Flavobacteriales bacterium]|nr:universal stress protein [Flavobacteriales bacterium]